MKRRLNQWFQDTVIGVQIKGIENLDLLVDKCRVPHDTCRPVDLNFK